MLRRSSRTLRLIAGGCLFALLCTQWASTPHIHALCHRTADRAAGACGEFDEAIAATRFTVSSDDAHEEHSALIKNADSNCAFCRSNDQRDNARPERFEAGFGAAPPVLAYADSAEERSSTLFARLRPARAPPIRRFA